MSRDLVGQIASDAYAFGLLGAAEGVRSWRRWPQEFTRKLVHIGAGLWVWGVLALFEHWYVGIIPFTSFIVLNCVFYRQKSFRAMDAADSSPGTIYFALSMALLSALFWRTGGAPDHAPIAVAAAMAMTLGDAFAAIIGRRWGRRTYSIWGGSRRSYWGSAAMAVFSFAGIACALLLVPGSALSPTSQPLAPIVALGQALIAALVATAAEAVSPAGTDNLSVPLATALALFLMGL